MKTFFAPSSFSSLPFALLLLVGCSSANAPTPSTNAPLASTPSKVVVENEKVVAPPKAWEPVTRSPWPWSVEDERLLRLSKSCGAPDASLAKVAAELASDRAKGLGAPDPDRIAALLRSHGEPHVRPRMVLASDRGAIDDEKLGAKLGEVKRDERTRCGVGVARTEEGKELLVAIAVDAHADLDPLPTRARTGEWLTLSATMNRPAANAKLVVLGSRGLPRTVPTSIDAASGKVRAKFALDRPGPFTIQLVAELANGPQPVLEARVFADVAPYDDEEPAPGEQAATAESNDGVALEKMVGALRKIEALPALKRDARLDTLAKQHVEKMLESKTIAHDVGEGDLTQRFETAGLAAKEIGENVARAKSIVQAHRVLHASPSHRMNLLRADYTHIGLATAKDESGTVYACEVFATRLAN